MTLDFMVTLFRLLYTYQTIGREIVKEEILDRRIAHLRAGDGDRWEAVMDSRPKEFQTVQMEMKDIVFDYFNIITKEYELAFEKWKETTEYVERITKIKLETEQEYVSNKYLELPAGLTKEKTQEIIKRKQEIVNQIMVRAMNERGMNPQGELQLDQRQLIMEIAKFDDIIFIDEGYRKEEIEKAIEVYKLDDREKENAKAEEEQRRAYMQMASMMNSRASAGAAPAIEGGS